MNCRTIFIFPHCYYPCTIKFFTFWNLLEGTKKLIITIDGKNSEEKLQYDINRKAENKSTLSSTKFDKYESLLGEEILPSDQSRIKVQAKFTYSHLGKGFEKQIKTIEDQWKKSFKALKPEENEEPESI